MGDETMDLQRAPENSSSNSTTEPLDEDIAAGQNVKKSKKASYIEQFVAFVAKRYKDTTTPVPSKELYEGFKNKIKFKKHTDTLRKSIQPFLMGAFKDSDYDDEKKVQMLFVTSTPLKDGMFLEKLKSIATMVKLDEFSRIEQYDSPTLKSEGAHQKKFMKKQPPVPASDIGVGGCQSNSG
ncbi:SPK domain-containing protein [Caenorhabditis elegans]|uniref:SPK domain-containing protein n=1 Tax=Caenorhabditis elegans TaxID=6239 RepID=Q9BIA6_CAEEL|nr:SPK domain-containing protein [Caenorhabditis elegans]CCD64847.1 SPK domain-containing protein [Caenorhabditis elegans]|eukprot:NP_495078.1 Uncharacterized protein CELE_C17C3.15 [Caenorhabditis elegans]